MSYAASLICPQEQQKEEIKSGREEQRNANQMRRERMRREAEHAHEQKSSQALREPESKKGPTERYSSLSGSDQRGLEVQQEQRCFEDPNDDPESNPRWSIRGNADTCWLGTDPSRSKVDENDVMEQSVRGAD